MFKPYLFFPLTKQYVLGFVLFIVGRGLPKKRSLFCHRNTHFLNSCTSTFSGLDVGNYQV